MRAGVISPNKKTQLKSSLDQSTPIWEASSHVISHLDYALSLGASFDESDALLCKEGEHAHRQAGSIRTQTSQPPNYFLVPPYALLCAEVYAEVFDESADPAHRRQ
jgi:hypothetical protein